MKTAYELGLNDQQYDALVKVLELFETGKMRHVPTKEYDDSVIVEGGVKFDGLFNMGMWPAIGDTSLSYSCGTVACIGGTAELVAGSAIFGGGNTFSQGLHDLFYPPTGSTLWGDITIEQATVALRSYLDTGEANWS